MRRRGGRASSRERPEATSSDGSMKSSGLGTAGVEPAERGRSGNPTPAVACATAVADDVPAERDSADATPKDEAAAPDAPSQRRPQHARIRVVPVEGRGLGVLATAAASCGDLLLAEEPLFEFNCTDADQLGKDFQALPDSRKEIALSLHDAAAASSKEAGKAKTLDGILVTNSLWRGTDPAFCLLFEQLSRFNHSCVPNCDWTWDEKAHEARVYASTDIREGEELCITYADLRASREERWKQLQRYHFECRCPCCMLTDCSESDRRRLRMREITVTLESQVQKDAKTGLEIVVELLELYNQEGIKLRSYGKKASFYAYQFSLLRGDMEQAKWWILRAYECSLWSHGRYHEQTLKLMDYANDPERHPANWYALRTGCVKIILVILAVWMSFRLLRSFWHEFQADRGPEHLRFGM